VTTSATTADGRVAGETRRNDSMTLAMACAATLLTLMNYCAPMTTLPEITAGLGTGVTGQTWILNGIALGLAALLLAAGSLADDYGRKRMGSGAGNTARYIGSSLGVAIVVAVVGAASAHGGLSHGADVALVVAAAGAVLGALMALLLGRRPVPR
jgi:MFS family permease